MLIKPGFQYQLLERDPDKRLGHRSDGSGLARLREQPWFSSLDWEVIGSKAAVPPFEPDVRDRLGYRTNL